MKKNTRKLFDIGFFSLVFLLFNHGIVEAICFVPKGSKCGSNQIMVRGGCRNLTDEEKDILNINCPEDNPGRTGAAGPISTATVTRTNPVGGQETAPLPAARTPGASLPYSYWDNYTTTGRQTYTNSYYYGDTYSYWDNYTTTGRQTYTNSYYYGDTYSYWDNYTTTGRQTYTNSYYYGDTYSYWDNYTTTGRQTYTNSYYYGDTYSSRDNYTTTGRQTYTNSYYYNQSTARNTLTSYQNNYTTTGRQTSTNSYNYNQSTPDRSTTSGDTPPTSYYNNVSAVTRASRLSYPYQDNYTTTRAVNTSTQSSATATVTTAWWPW